MIREIDYSQIIFLNVLTAFWLILTYSYIFFYYKVYYTTQKYTIIQKTNQQYQKKFIAISKSCKIRPYVLWLILK